MKSLTMRDLDIEDSLGIHFEGRFNPHDGVESELAPFLRALEEHAAEWMPDVVNGKRQRRYSRAAVMKSLSEERGQKSASVGFSRTTSPAMSLALYLWLGTAEPSLDLSLYIQPLSFFSTKEASLHFVEMIRAWASRYPVPHAAAHSVADSQLAGAPYFGRDEKTSSEDGFDKIYEVSWLNVFGPKLVASVGRERMLSTPAHRVEELPDGSVLLVTWPIAAEFASDEARVAQARAFVHLRPDLDFDTVLKGLRERSATLAPVEPRFQADVAPLLSRVVDEVAISERQRRIAELNAYQPPEPEEWLPTAFPSDVEDPAAALEHYSYLSERLVALLHTPVPSVFEARPDSLTDVDFHFWRENFPETFEREHIDALAVPAIGAYLGEVLVKHLGGQWIPRQKQEEAQVRVGNRVWLPFLRAHRYMRTRQSLLDFSLTQLYRAAERHRG